MKIGMNSKFSVGQGSAVSSHAPVVMGEKGPAAGSRLPVIEPLEGRVLLSGTMYSGETKLGVGTDDFSFSAPNGARVAFALFSDDSSTVMRAFSSSGSQIVSSGVNSVGGGAMEFTAGGGTYDVRVDTSRYFIFTLAVVPSTQHPDPDGDTDGGTLVTGTTLSGTVGLEDLDVYSFTAGVGDNFTVHLKDQYEKAEPQMSIYRPSGKSLGSVAITSPGGLASLSSQSAPDTGTYWVIVRSAPDDGVPGSPSPNPRGAYQIYLTKGAQAPANDSFANAKVLPNFSSLTSTGTNVGATKQAGEPAHAGNSGGKSVWYKWVAPATGSVTVSTAGSSFNTLLGIYKGGSVGALTTVASNDNATTSTTTSKATFAATLGTAYYIAVDGYGGASGNISLALNEAPPVNDKFANAKLVTGASVALTGTNIAATRESGEPLIAGNAGGRSVWYKWVATGTGTVTITTSGSQFDTTLGVYKGSAVNALTLVGGNNNAGSGLTYSKVTFKATKGVTYRIAIDGFNGGGGAAAGTLKLNIAAPITASLIN